MNIKSLENTSLEEIVSCLCESFADYFVPMSPNVDYWSGRFKAARLSFELSFGMFESGRLVGFILHGIDNDVPGDLMAFNTGTGVLPDFRGLGCVDQLYAVALPLLIAAGVKTCRLEVIQKNDRAIRVYERIGFHISRSLRCFKGKLELTAEGFRLEERGFAALMTRQRTDQRLYSWDCTNMAMLAAGSLYRCYEVYHLDSCLGYFVLNPETGFLPQFELYEAAETNGGWAGLFKGVSLTGGGRVED